MNSAHCSSCNRLVVVVVVVLVTLILCREVLQRVRYFNDDWKLIFCVLKSLHFMLVKFFSDCQNQFIGFKVTTSRSCVIFDSQCCNTEVLFS